MTKPIPTSRWPELRVVPGGKERPSPPERSERADRPEPASPVLLGLLCCDQGGVALGVVRQVLEWDGQVLRLRISPDPEAGLGAASIVVEVPLPASPTRQGD